MADTEEAKFLQLIGILSDKTQSQHKRASAAFALGAWEDERSTQALLNALIDEDHIVVEVAMFRLA